MSSMAAHAHAYPSVRFLFPESLNRRHFSRHSNSLNDARRILSRQKRHVIVAHIRKPSTLIMRSLQEDHAGNFGDETSKDNDDVKASVTEGLNVKQENKTNETTGLFLGKLGIAIGMAALVTIFSISVKQPVPGSSLFGIQCLNDVSSSSILTKSNVGFSFKAFGYRIVLPEYAPGWVYFWLLMAAGCGICISEEALNIWVGISLSRLLSLGGTWQSFTESFSRSAPYIISTCIWVYLGVCISDMIPFYIGKLFRETKASDDVYAKLGVGKERALSLTNAVKRYGNLIGFVERFSIGVRNPTAFLAGALGISPERFFAGVCLGGLITVPLQFAIGFALRKRPVFAIATVATTVGIWTLFPYGLAASTALFLYLRRRYST